MNLDRLESSSMFRAVTLPDHISGEIFLHNMPGRFGQSLDDALQEISQSNIKQIISLTPIEEIERNSPDYFRALTIGTLPCRYECFPVTDFGVPKDWESFEVFVREIARQVLAGESILIHCGAGIGRTGTFACCLLIALGIPPEQVSRIVSEAGSGCETAEQKKLVSWFASRTITIHTESQSTGE